ncbi:hypothetical protein NBRC116494_03300 [Aurantivibrio plasticivorans]
MAKQPITPADAPSATTSATAAGHTNSQQSGTTGDELIDTINSVFALFRVNYHNQYYAAFGDTQLLNQTKKLWFESLKRFTPQQILQGAKLAIEQSEYLPTLHKMIVFCQGDPSSYGLPNPHQAYVEACNAPNPKTLQRWSHAAVYHAGRACGWYFIASNPEHIAFPVFKQHYQEWTDRVLNGEVLPDIEVPKLPSDTATPLSKDENRSRMKAMRESLKI